MAKAWRLAGKLLPWPVKALALATLLAFTLPPILLLYLLPRSSLDLLGQLNLPWILEWTIIQATASATIAVAVGAPVGVASGYYGSRIAGLYRVLGLPVFMAPSVAVVLGFRWLAQLPHTPEWLAQAPHGIIVVHSWFNIPLAAVLVYSSLAGIPAEVYDYVETAGIRGYRLWRHLIIPASIPGILSAWLLTFIYSFTGLAAPLMVEGAAYKYYTLEAWIYTIFKGFPAYRSLSALLALLQASLLAGTALILLRVQTRTPRGELGERIRRPRRDPVSLALEAYSILLLGYLYLPLLGVFLESLTIHGHLTLDNYRRLVTGPLPVPPGASFPRALLNSLLYAVIAMAGAVTLSIPLVVERDRVSGRLAGLAPILFSPVTVGVALYFTLYLALRSVLGHTLAIVLLIGLAHISMSLPLASRAVDSGLSRIPREAVEYMLSIGLRGYRLLYQLARVAGPGLSSAALLAVAASLGEFGAVLVLTEPSTWSLGVLTYQLYGGGRLLGPASACASVLLSLTLFSAFIVSRRVREWF